MKILGDYHTHTTFSHGSGSVLRNAESAKQKGLKEIAITDHGFGHRLYAVKKAKFASVIADAKNAETATGVKVLVGIEANFLSEQGDIDLTPEEIKNLDVLLVGYHRFVKNSFKDKLRFTLTNLFRGKTKNQKIIQRNTNMIINALEKHPIDVITHLKHGYAVDVIKVAKKAVETNTFIELNAGKMLFTKPEIKQMLGLGVKFIVNSDAHTPEKVGVFEEFLKKLQDFDIPEENIVNLNKTPQFKRKKL